MNPYNEVLRAAAETGLASAIFVDTAVSKGENSVGLAHYAFETAIALSSLAVGCRSCVCLMEYRSVDQIGAEMERHLPQLQTVVDLCLFMSMLAQALGSAAHAYKMVGESGALMDEMTHSFNTTLPDALQRAGVALSKQATH